MITKISFGLILLSSVFIAGMEESKKLTKYKFVDRIKQPDGSYLTPVFNHVCKDLSFDTTRRNGRINQLLSTFCISLAAQEEAFEFSNNTYVKGITATKSAIFTLLLSSSEKKGDTLVINRWGHGSCATSNTILTTGGSIKDVSLKCNETESQFIIKLLVKANGGVSTHHFCGTSDREGIMFVEKLHEKNKLFVPKL